MPASLVVPTLPMHFNDVSVIRIYVTTIKIYFKIYKACETFNLELFLIGLDPIVARQI